MPALLVPTVDRPGRLRQLLDSADGVGLDRVIVADCGEGRPQDREAYGRDWGFRLSVLDMAPGTGLGRARRVAWEHADAEYVVAADDDHVLTDGLWTLVEQLDADASIGGIAGDVVEPERDRRWQSAKDFREGERVIHRTANVAKEREVVAGEPFLQFDFIPYPAVYRAAALRDYAWDDAYPLGRCHADLYVGHWTHTDWRFGINPEVTFRHYPGGDSISETRGDREAAMTRAREYFRAKWGKQLVMGKPYWREEALA